MKGFMTRAKERLVVGEPTQCWPRCLYFWVNGCVLLTAMARVLTEARSREDVQWSILLIFWC